ncbi:hypothetical protein FGO68_gene14433 [Halteria grandinella]|uniref:Uncharacterized protein n=1 Tax=Halteria grandinella TaxID=5974 RepID=A0A8J8P3B4_HALGN|nr:hypothetical protein FGO68_gene14433 [Halteria grandinella]
MITHWLGEQNDYNFVFRQSIHGRCFPRLTFKGAHLLTYWNQYDEGDQVISPNSSQSRNCMLHVDYYFTNKISWLQVWTAEQQVSVTQQQKLSDWSVSLRIIQLINISTYVRLIIQGCKQHYVFQ